MYWVKFILITVLTFKEGYVFIPQLCFLRVSTVYIVCRKLTRKRNMMRKRTFVIFLVALPVFLIWSESHTGTVNTIKTHYQRMIRRFLRTKPFKGSQEQYQNLDELRSLSEDNKCYGDCQAFRQFIFAPDWKFQKATIYILTSFNREGVHRSIELLDKNFPYPYPLILFYEGANLTSDQIQGWKELTNRRIFFQEVSFRLPSNTTAPETTEHCNFGLGYRHMCRFHACAVYDEPILQGELMDILP